MVVSSNSDSAPRRSDMRTYQSLRVADPQFARHQPGGKGVAYGGESGSLPSICLDQAVERCRDPFVRINHCLGRCKTTDSMKIALTNGAKHRAVSVELVKFVFQAPKRVVCVGARSSSVTNRSSTTADRS